MNRLFLISLTMFCTCLTAHAQPEKNDENYDAWYVAMGPAIGSGLGTTKAMSQLYLGYGWASSENLIKIYIGGAASENDEYASASGFGLSYSHFLSRGNKRWFVNGDMISGGVNSNYDLPALDADSTFEEKLEHDHEKERLTESNSKNGYLLGIGVGRLFVNPSVDFEIGFQSNVFLGKLKTGIPATHNFRVGVFF